MYKLSINRNDFSGVNNDFFQRLCQFESLNDEANFNDFCKWIIDNSPKKDQTPSQRFIDYLGSSTIKTPWGGVYITKHDHPLVEKYLVIKSGHYLAFEKHEKKEENILVEEGEGILLKREGDSIKVLPLSQGSQFQFAPGDEHCVIAPQNMLIYEKSLDHKGMDQDLIFIFKPTL